VAGALDCPWEGHLTPTTRTSSFLHIFQLIRVVASRSSPKADSPPYRQVWWNIVLTVQSVSKRFADRRVLDAVTFSLDPGEKVGLVGPNGSGKSTLLRIIAGLESPDSGTVRLGPRTTVGYLPQQLEPDGAMTVQEALGAARTEWAAARRALEMATAALADSDGDSDRVIEDYAEALERFEAAGGWAVEHEIDVIREGLGLSEIPPDQPVAELSGGQKTRVSLGSLLLLSPTVLLLDEPTNYLDVPALAWLEYFVAESEQAMLIVSHDRRFLDRTVTSILEIDPSSQRLTRYAGTYSDYLAQKERDRAAHEARYHDQQEEIARVEAEIRSLKGKAQATEHGTINFHYRKIAKGVARRAKVQERRMQRSLEGEARIERPEDSKRLFLRGLTETAIDDRRLAVAATAVGCRLGNRDILRNIDLTIRGRDRVAIIGPNGSGKTTLLRALAGCIPVSGEVRLGQGVAPGYLHQELLKRTIPDSETILSAMRNAGGREESELRGILDQFLFSGDEAYKPVRVLSYGERVRLELAKMVVAGTDMLLLDEPTSHLDLPSVERLEAALERYRGPMVVVSHDRAFLENIGVSRVYVLEDGSLRECAGSQPLDDAWQSIS
jgi:ATPase subunit of ABC transporter with duplicated ATPase domains